MATVGFKFVWEVDDVDGFEWAFFDADSASGAQRFNYYCFLVFKADSLHFGSHDRAETVTNSVTSFGFTPVCIKHSDSCHVNPTINARH